MTAQPNEPGSRRIELVVWRGELETLALRLGIRPDDLLAALGRVQDLRASPIKLTVDLANTAPVWSAVRRRLAAVPDTATSARVARLCGPRAENISVF